MNSDHRLPFIIFLTPISCDGSNRLWRQRLLQSPCSLWRHKQTLVGVIRPLAGGKCRRFRRVTERYRFHRYLCFHCMFCVQVFCILFYTTRVTISYQNCIHSNSTLTTFFHSVYKPAPCWELGHLLEDHSSRTHQETRCPVGKYIQLLYFMLISCNFIGHPPKDHLSRTHQGTRCPVGKYIQLLYFNVNFL